MKKLLSVLSALSMSSCVFCTTVSCASRPVESILGTSNIITVGNKKYYDIAKWSSDVVSNTNMKNNFINNFEDVVKKGGTINYGDIIAQYEYNSDNYKKGESLITKSILDYQDGANAGDMKSATKDVINKNLIFKIYDASDENNIKQIETIKNNTVEKNGKDDIKVTKRSDTDVYVIHFKIEVDSNIEIKDNIFLGARMNVVDKVDSKDKGEITASDLGKNYYENIISDYSKLNSNSKNNLSIHKNSKGEWETGTYDYMFDIEFYFSIS